jgi:hypothetical protein
MQTAANAGMLPTVIEQLPLAAAAVPAPTRCATPSRPLALPASLPLGPLHRLIHGDLLPTANAAATPEATPMALQTVSPVGSGSPVVVRPRSEAAASLEAAVNHLLDAAVQLEKLHEGRTMKCCAWCKAQSTPSWRRMHGVQPCNACGLFVKRHGPAAITQGAFKLTKRGRPRKYATGC